MHRDITHPSATSPSPQASSGTADTPDYYRDLGLHPTAGIDDIHKAYWSLALRCHPDNGGSHEEMVRISKAWMVLSDPVKKARYDQVCRSGNGLRCNRFLADLREADTKAASYAKSWQEFEAAYQDQHYSFSRDFYGDVEGTAAAGPYSPLVSPASPLPGLMEVPHDGYRVARVIEDTAFKMTVAFSSMLLLYVLSMVGMVMVLYGTVSK